MSKHELEAIVREMRDANAQLHGYGYIHLHPNVLCGWADRLSALTAPSAETPIDDSSDAFKALLKLSSALGNPCIDVGSSRTMEDALVEYAITKLQNTRADYKYQSPPTPEEQARSTRAQSVTPEMPRGEVTDARWLLSQIIAALPTRRDWLDPALESAARSLLSSRPKPAGVEASAAVAFTPTAELTLILEHDNGAAMADAALALIRKGGMEITTTTSEMYLHQLRFRVAEDPSLEKRIKVFYRDPKTCELLPVGLGYEDELRWPKGFLREAWETECKIQKVRHPTPPIAPLETDK
jgi:hypothetical protein